MVNKRGQKSGPDSCYVMSRMKVLKIVALIYLFSLIGLLIVATREQGCINSITVQSINIERQGSSVSVPSCFFEETHSGTPVLEDQKIIESFSGVIQNFEQMAKINKFFYKPNSLRILIKENSDLQVSYNKIIMDIESAKDLSLVRRSIAQAWMLSYATPELRSNNFLQEVVTDILSFVFWNDLSWEKEVNFNRWLKYVYSDRDICETKYSPASYASVCKLMKDSDGAEFDQISMWSLRPLVINRVLDLYDRMDVPGKSDFLNYMIAWVLTYEGDLNIQPLDLKSISSVYNQTMNALIGDIYAFDEALSVDFVFEFVGPQPYSMMNQKNDLPFYLTQNILFGYDDNVFINLRNGSRFASKENFVRHWVKVQDTFPTLSSAKNIPAEYLTILQAKEPYDVFQFFKKIDEISDFPWPEEFDSLTLYVPSLELLGRLAPKELLSAKGDLKNLMLNPNIEKILGWSPVQVY